MDKIAIIQLARYGDIISMLPFAYELSKQASVTVFVNREFVSILEACSYVTPYVYEHSHRDVGGAADRAYNLGFRNIVKCQVDGNSAIKVRLKNFIQEQWLRAGFLNRFHDLPLIFDARDYDAEQESLRKYLPSNDKPLLLTNFKSFSSPYRYSIEWVNELTDQYNILDLTNVQLPKIHHLLPFLEHATALLTVDTSILHLAYVTGTPTIALNGNTPTAYYNSEPRSHWVAKFTYEESNLKVHQSKIIDILRNQSFDTSVIEEVATAAKKHIYHVVNWFLGNKDENPRILNAEKTWQFNNYTLLRHLTNGRSSKQLGDTRELPYIKDIIDYGATKLKDSDYLMFSNSDVCLIPEALDIVREKLSTHDACYSRRVDVTDASRRLNFFDIKSMIPHVGADLFVFKVSWWKQHKDEFPDLFLACEGWDAIARFLMKKYVYDPEINPPIIYHQRHDSHWMRPDVIHTSPTQKWNREHCAAWAKDNGFTGALYKETESKYLFRADK